MRVSVCIGICSLFIAFVVPAVSAPFLYPPDTGIPTLSENRRIEGLNTEMVSALVDGQSFTRDHEGVRIKRNAKDKMYHSSYALPDKPFSIILPLAVEQGTIQVIVGNVKVVVLPRRTEIYQDGRLIRAFELASRGVGVERGFGLEKKLESSVRVHTEGYAPGTGAQIVLPARLSIKVAANTVGSIGPWEWQQGMK